MDAFWSPLYHPGYIAPGHRGCIICAQVTRPRVLRHLANLVKMRYVAASLPLSYVPRLEAGPDKQETPGMDVPEVSTHPDLCWQMRRAAGAQSDTVNPR